jgi:ABC-type bacteriocin/lantibiotic exporter with double-glycine peptidase domain
VLYDGEEIGHWGVDKIREQVGVVNQSFALFSMTIAENIAVASPRASRADVVDAAQIAGIHDDIVRFPRGYDTFISGELGRSTLSGGQLQRLALARALVRRPAILVLDEATSALDPLTESRITQHLAELGCTRITVTHRLNTIRGADRIFVISDGRIAQAGTHDALARAGGEYARLLLA